MSTCMQRALARLTKMLACAATRDAKFLETMTADRSVLLTGITDSRIDTGGWLRGARIAFAIEPGQLRLFARGKAPFLTDIPLDAVAQSRYNHTTGELMLAPDPPATVTRLRLPPLIADDMLRILTKQDSTPNKRT